MTKILITGANGQLGNELRKISTHYKDYIFQFQDIDTLDLTDFKKTEKFITQERPDYIINCAAYTAVDKAETDRDNAFNINSDVPGILAQIANKQNTILFHISTDFVFGGDKSVPYKEDDKAYPLSIYAQSKLLGEKNVLSYENTIVIRTSWLYSHFGHNFVNTILKLAKERECLSIVYDQIGTPTYAADLAKVILQFIAIIPNKGVEYLQGIYHYSNEGIASWYDFALEIIWQKKINCTIDPILSKEYKLPAQRPSYSVLNKNKIKDLLQIKIPHWKESLQTCLEKIDL